MGKNAAQQERLSVRGYIATLLLIALAGLLVIQTTGDLLHRKQHQTAESLRTLAEVTESVVLEVSDQLPRTLDHIKELGVRVHMDDFGTGYSSLSSLKDLPVDVLKIDRSFLQTHADGRAGLGIMSGIMTMARSLDIEVVAEGIEDEESLDALVALNCDFGQGFFFSKPVDTHTASEMVLSARSWLTREVAQT